MGSKEEEEAEPGSGGAAAGSRGPAPTALVTIATRRRPGASREREPGAGGDPRAEESVRGGVLGLGGPSWSTSLL